jgi:hypothetical protein
MSSASSSIFFLLAGLNHDTLCLQLSEPFLLCLKRLLAGFLAKLCFQDLRVDRRLDVRGPVGFCVDLAKMRQMAESVYSVRMSFLHLCWLDAVKDLEMLRQRLQDFQIIVAFFVSVRLRSGLLAPACDLGAFLSRRLCRFYDRFILMLRRLHNFFHIRHILISIFGGNAGKSVFSHPHHLSKSALESEDLRVV